MITSSLWYITCYMGSHSITCHLDLAGGHIPR